MPGSKGPAPFAVWIIPGVLESRTCPLPMVTQAERTWLQLYDAYKAGFLALAGAALDQPAAYQEAMTLIDREFAKINRERMEQARGRN